MGCPLVSVRRTPRLALEPATKQKLNEVKVLSVLPQDEVIVRAETYGASAALGGGLIGAMIDSKVAEGRQNTVQGMMASFYGSVDDFDYRPSFQKALSATLSTHMPGKFAGWGAESVKAWSGNQGVAYRAALNEATQEITRMLALDLAASATDPADAPKATLEKVDGQLRQPIAGTVLASGADRKILRNIAGNMYSLPQ